MTAEQTASSVAQPVFTANLVAKISLTQKSQANEPN